LWCLAEYLQNKQKQFAGLWGGTEGLITITRTGSVLPKGTIVVFESTTANVTSPSHYDIYTCGSLDTNWTKTALSGGSIGGFNLSSDDDIWIMQGGTWINDIGHQSSLEEIIEGYEVTTAGNGVEGLKAWREMKPDIIISDVDMPIMNGFEMANLIERYELLFHKEVIITKTNIFCVEIPLNKQQVDHPIKNTKQK
jgi:hypothetical protein